MIGCGAMGRQVLSVLERTEETDLEVVGLLETPDGKAAAEAVLDGAYPVFDDLGALLDRGPNVIAECAGHSAVATHGEAVLAAGKGLIVISVGALADEALLERLRAAAERGGGRILLPAGALAGLDAIAAARLAGLDRVRLTSTKPPRAWLGTPAEVAVDLPALTAPVVFFSGSARDAARQYPKNANVAAAVALAGLGFERTEVRLVADPAAEGNSHHIVAEGAFGAMEVEMRGRALPDNPKTSMLGGLSVARALVNCAAAIAI